MESLFGRRTSKLSEVFSEAINEFLMALEDLILNWINATFGGPRLGGYASTVKEKSKQLENVVGFIDGTVIGVSRPQRDETPQSVVYNGHKRKHPIKYQAITTPWGLAMHLDGLT